MTFFSHCCPSHLQQCLGQEVLNRNLLVFMKSTPRFMSLWMPEGPCAQASGHSSSNSLGEPIHSHTSYRCCIYLLSACRHLFLSLQAQTFSWPFTERANQTSNLTCWKLNMRYPLTPKLAPSPVFSISGNDPYFPGGSEQNRSLLWSSWIWILSTISSVMHFSPGFRTQHLTRISASTPLPAPHTSHLFYYGKYMWHKIDPLTIFKCTIQSH